MNLWSKYLLPAAVAGFVLAETAGTEALRRTEPSDLLRRIDITALQVDTVQQDTSAAVKAAAEEGKKDRKKDRKKGKKQQDRPKPPPKPKQVDIFIWDEDTTFFSQPRKVDTLPAITARDTMKVPDSLRTTDPFLYKWYVATKDSLIHRVVVDSLKAAGDSTDWMVIDSLYLADSTAIARAAFERWYSSLSKEEKKRYDYEQLLPKLLKQQDSILHRKDSIQAVRDSIRQNTPRILESRFIPDSMQYKRFITWHRDKSFNRVELFDYDTTFRRHFYDYPFLREDVNGTWLGVAGSAVQTYDFFKRNRVESISFYEPYESWTYTPETLPQWNTKTPYTELEYYGTLLSPSSKESDNIRLFTTQNILPQLNYALEYKMHGGAGILLNEETKNKTTVVSVNWLGKNYVAHAGLIRNKVSRQENGGIRDLQGIIDPQTYFEDKGSGSNDVRELPVSLSGVTNAYTKKTWFFDQTYRLPLTFLKMRKVNREIEADEAYRDSVTAAWLAAHPALPDSTAVADSLDAEPVPVDSTDLKQMEEYLAGRAAARDAYVASLDSLDMTTLFFGTNSEYSIYTKVFRDKISASDAVGSGFFGNNFYINPSASVDSLRYARLDNRVFVRVQPWSEDFIVSRIEGGIGDRWLSHYMQGPDNVVMPTANVNWNTVYTYAGAEGHLGKAIEWNALGQYNLLGAERNDLSLDADAKMTIYPFRRHKQSPLTVRAAFGTSLKRPEYFQQQFYSNHYRWNLGEDFSKVSTTKVQGSVDIPRWRLAASAGYALLAHNIYYDSLGVARQNAEPMSVLSATLDKDFVIADFLHLDHRLLFQLSSNQEVLPLPTLAARLRYYIQFNIVRADVMKMQIGADIWANTPWLAQGYNPVTGTFMAQKKHELTQKDPETGEVLRDPVTKKPVMTHDYMRYTNGPAFDVFLNVQWKRACIFVKWENAGMGWPMPMGKRDYFSADNYISTDRQVKIGIYWPFYTMSGRNATLSSKAGSGMGGGGGGGLGGMMGGLRGATGGMGGGGGFGGGMGGF